MALIGALASLTYVADCSCPVQSAESASSDFVRRLGHPEVLPTAFDDLPDDVILEIFYLLDLRSIIMLRFTCRRFAKVSTAHSTWSQALRQVAAACPSRGLLELERPLLTYTSAELEEMVTRVVRLDQAWSRPQPAPNRLRYFLHSMGISQGHLLPGGRWLLLAGDTSAEGVDYYDLDLDQDMLMSRLLLPPGFSLGEGTRIPTEMVIDIKINEPLLTFDLALMVYDEAYDTRGPYEPKQCTVSLWKVVLDDDFQGLSSIHLTSANFMGALALDDWITMSLLDGLVVRSAVLARQSAFEVSSGVLEIHGTKELAPEDRRDASPFNYGRVIRLSSFLQRISDVHLLPGRRFVAASADDICVYLIPQLSQVDSPADPVAEIPIVPYWSYEWKLGPYLMSTVMTLPYTLGTATSVVMLSTDRMLGRFTIPTEGAVGIETVETDPTGGPKCGLSCLRRSHGLWWYTRTMTAGCFSCVPATESRDLQTFSGLSSVPTDNAEANADLILRPFAPSAASADDPWLFDGRSGRVVVALSHVNGQTFKWGGT